MCVWQFCLINNITLFVFFKKWILVPKSEIKTRFLRFFFQVRFYEFFSFSAFKPMNGGDWINHRTISLIKIQFKSHTQLYCYLNRLFILETSKHMKIGQFGLFLCFVNRFYWLRLRLWVYTVCTSSGVIYIVQQNVKVTIV